MTDSAKILEFTQPSNVLTREYEHAAPVIPIDCISDVELEISVNSGGREVYILSETFEDQYSPPDAS